MPPKKSATKKIQEIDLSNVRVRKGIVEILDMSSSKDENFAYILIYRDVETNYVHLRGLISKTPKEIGLELIKIFMNFGPPYIISFVTDDEIFTQTVHFINKIIPDKINTSIRQSLSPYSLFIREKILTWINQNDCNSWVSACYEVQWDINNAKINGVSPYEKLFNEERVDGHEPNIELVPDFNEDFGYNLTYLEKQLEADMVIVDRVCVVCGSVTFEEHSCDKCNNAVHAHCRNLGKDARHLCLLCFAKGKHLEKLRARARVIDHLLAEFE